MKSSVAQEGLITAYGNTILDKRLSVSDTTFFIFTVALFAAISLAVVALSAAFLRNIWMIGDTGLFYRMADVILNGGTPYIDFKDPKPPLIFFTLTLPAMLGQQLVGGLLLVGISNFVSALIVTNIGWKLYGRRAGLAAGLLFIVNMGLTEGFFILTEPFTVTFILLSAYVLLFMDSERKYLLAGVFAGLAIGFKQYALLMIPLSVFFMYRKGELEGAPGYFIGLLLTLAAIFGSIFIVYGIDAGASAVYWSFGVADSYVTQGFIGDIPAYKASDPLISAANFLLEASLFISLVTLAAASFVLDRPVTAYEELFFVSAIAFLATLLVRQYLHYWALALPFIILLCVRAFKRRINSESAGITMRKYVRRSL